MKERILRATEVFVRISHLFGVKIKINQKAIYRKRLLTVNYMISKCYITKSIQSFPFFFYTIKIFENTGDETKLTSIVQSGYISIRVVNLPTLYINHNRFIKLYCNIFFFRMYKKKIIRMKNTI